MEVSERFHETNFPAAETETAEQMFSIAQIHERQQVIHSLRHDWPQMYCENCKETEYYFVLSPILSG